MHFLFLAFGMLISLVSSVASINGAGRSPRARHALHERRGQVHRQRYSSYSSVDVYERNDFFDDSLWTFYGGIDPTGGSVNYLSRAEAQEKGLAYVRKDNKTVLRVDSHTNLPLGARRNSVRIMSMKTFKYGVIIADLESMPSGCSVWPAFWTLGSGKEWPYGGEIDIIEGVNNDLLNQYTFHTGIDQECSIPNKVPKDNAPGSFMGTIVNTDCRSSEKADTGCAVRDTSKISYGPGFDKAGGGIFALLRNKEGFKIWHFERHSIPADIRARNPNPSSWPTPNAALSVDECAGVDSFFTPQNLILDITLCGGFGTANYQADGCPGTCAERVTKGCNYIDAAWVINSIILYHS